MRVTRVIATSLVGVALVVSAGHACPFCKKQKFGTFIGETVVMGNGTARSWVEIDKAGKPTAIGLTFTETALDGLATDKPTNGMDGYEYTLNLPKQASMTPFNHLGVDWNPMGHIPKGIYDVPHFDFHFYMVPTSVRSQIVLDKANLKVCQRKPSLKEIPKGYMYAPGGEYKYMGAHWVDTATPELHGQKFTQTFIYGSYDGDVIFIEPMVTKAMLDSKISMWAPIKQPEQYAKKGMYYPTKYSVKYDQTRKEYSITLFGFAKR